MSGLKKITWAQVGRVAEPGRYLFKFGWLTIAPEDLWVWQKYPNAAFTLFRTLSTPAETDEYRLGSFELRTESNFSESGR